MIVLQRSYYCMQQSLASLRRYTVYEAAICNVNVWYNPGMVGKVHQMSLQPVNNVLKISFDIVTMA